MKKVNSLHSFDQLKVLADPRRLEIMRLLMSSSTTLAELSYKMNRPISWISHHIQILESKRLVERCEIESSGKRSKKFYRARSAAFLLGNVILPQANVATAVISGGQDPALEQVAETLSEDVNLLYFPGNSLDAMANLRSGYCQIAGSDLLSVNNEYKLSFVCDLFPEGDIEVITFAHRMQGLMIAKMNPCRIMQLADLATTQARFANRERGTGSRLWFDSEIQRLSLPTKAIHGYQNTVRSETEAAKLVESGKADVAIGLQATAEQRGFHFIPLFEERYDLILRQRNKQLLQPFFDYLQTSEFRALLSALPGYNSKQCGELISLKSYENDE